VAISDGKSFARASSLKILVVCQALDLSIRHLGITPAWWQIMKGLYEAGAELVAVPYIGRGMDSLWWSSYENPSLLEYKAYDKFERALTLVSRMNRMVARQTTQSIIRPLAHAIASSNWPKCLDRILELEGDVEAILILTVPINHLNGVVAKVKKHHRIPVVYYDGDTPTSLPRHGGLSLSYYDGADISEYDAFMVNSKGVVPELVRMGAKEVHVVYWGVDPEVFRPSTQKQFDYDVSFYGIGSRLREQWIREMISYPSLEMNKERFVVGGSSFNVELGNAIYEPKASYMAISRRSKICLNIVRKPHAETYGSSICRVFELASMGCCVVSNPYLGIEEWFDIGKEMFVVHSQTEATELYRKLLIDDDLRRTVGDAARVRVRNEHTNLHRGQQILEILKHLS